jgi:hypothetical protein
LLSKYLSDDILIAVLTSVVDVHFTYSMSIEGPDVSDRADYSAGVKIFWAVVGAGGVFIGVRAVDVGSEGRGRESRTGWFVGNVWVASFIGTKYYFVNVFGHILISCDICSCILRSPSVSLEPALIMLVEKVVESLNEKFGGELEKYVVAVNNEDQVIVMKLIFVVKEVEDASNLCRMRVFVDVVPMIFVIFVAEIK